jgi:hypothetical protein
MVAVTCWATAACGVAIQAANTPNNDKTTSQVNGILFFTKTSSVCRQSGQIRKLKGSRRLKDCLVSVGAQLWFC